MGGRVEVDPDGLLRASTQIGDLGARLRALAARAEAALAPGSAAWGDDKFGARFAAGAQGFAAGGDGTATSTGNVAETLDEVSDGQSRAAGALRNNELASTESF
ncbi:PE domain-containing protein [Nocardia jiangsuensis]|uniref:PE domain-containing protein n=1 Tax=Nocardia jiangsuensis TaxID=1691563 RepID=A0ABV8DWP1_9NOCA